METERTPRELHMRIESRLLFAAALFAILVALLAGHNRAIADEKRVASGAPVWEGFGKPPYGDYSLQASFSKPLPHRPANARGTAFEPTLITSEGK